MSYTLLSHPGSNPKLAKGDKLSVYLTTGLSLRPAYDFCTSASPACRAACLNMCGRGAFNKTQVARQRRSDMFRWHRDGDFKRCLDEDVARFQRYCLKRNYKPAVRLNVFSDLVWEEIFPELFGRYPGVQFYDYTKHAYRCMKRYSLPENYHLTFSRSEVNAKDCQRVLRSGKCSVAVVFHGGLPRVALGRKVVDGDLTDLRFLDPPGLVVGLKAKGKRAKKDQSGFVIQV